MDTRNRTWLCCVVFLDVVSFTRHHLQAQMAIKNHLDTQIKKLLLRHGRDDYILLDRGDGAAVCFLIDPETALYFALDLRDAVRDRGDDTVPYEIRIGINLGPIRIVLDVNGDKTTLGEGINCAARIMDFAGAGQIFVSRSFYEVIGCLSQEYAELFSYLGKKADKHVREFDVYEVAAAHTAGESATPARTTPAGQPPAPRWSPEVLESRIHSLTEEIGPMARILVQRAAQHAGTLEELDRRLAEPDIRIAPVQERPAMPECGFDTALLEQAERQLATFLGPIARVLVRRAAGQVQDPAALGRLLAQELADETERSAFLSVFNHPS